MSEYTIIAIQFWTSLSRLYRSRFFEHGLLENRELEQVLRAYVRVEQPAERREDQPHRPLSACRRKISCCERGLLLRP